MLLQNDEYASYGNDDSALYASADDIRRYTGKSALYALDALSIHFLNWGMLWRATDDTISTKEQQQRMTDSTASHAVL